MCILTTIKDIFPNKHKQVTNRVGRICQGKKSKYQEQPKQTRNKEDAHKNILEEGKTLMKLES